ncbi:hypothetical protein BH20CHL6_BH20CHL6_07610 [soil metagenome]
MTSAQRMPKTLLWVLVGLALAVAGCAQGGSEVITDDHPPGFFPPPAATLQGEQVRALYPLIFWIAVVVFFLVEGLLLLAILRRRKLQDGLPPQIHGSNKLELLWTSIPLIVVIGLFLASTFTLARMESGAAAAAPEDVPAASGAPGEDLAVQPQAPAVTVDVIAFQWQWTFEYEEEGLSFTGLGADGPVMVVPVDEPVGIRLHATDVIHSFYVPQFLFKRDVIPGRVNEFVFTVTEPGVYTGQCAEFCGLAHAQMFFQVRAVPRADYDAWVEVEQDRAAATPTPAPSGDGGGTGGAVLEVAAENAQEFTVDTLQAPSGVALTIQFDNRDPNALHNVAITDATAEGDWTGMPLADPGEQVTYTAPALAPGQYEFYCSVHPNMRGALAVD